MIAGVSIPAPVPEAPPRGPLRVELPGREYRVFVGRGLLARAGELLRAAAGAGREFAVVSDTHVWALHGPRFLEGMAPDVPGQVLQVPPGERSKSLRMAGRLFTGLLEAGCDRRTAVVAFGGGVVGDLAGFVAATYMRGVPLLMVPTTLLAMVDSSVGGKVAVNHPLGKNTIGAFHQPLIVVADLDTLTTLPRRELAAGAVEAFKYGLLGDRELLDYCLATPFEQWDLERLVRSSVADKAAVVTLDEREAGPRRRLNLGHTMGHALEAATRYRRYLHGEAVALGTLYVLELARLLGRSTEGDFRRLHELYRRLDLPLALPATPFSRLLELMHHDKKAVGGRLLFVLPVGLGAVEELSEPAPSVLQAAYTLLRKDLAATAPRTLQTRRRIR